MYNWFWTLDLCIKEHENTKPITVYGPQSGIRKTGKNHRLASLTKEEREKYDESIKVYRDQLVTIAFAKEKGIEEGMEKGRKEREKKETAGNRP